MRMLVASLLTSMILASSVSARTDPPGAPLKELVKKADLIVVAKVANTDPVTGQPIALSSGEHSDLVVISRTLKGKPWADKSAIVVTNEVSLEDGKTYVLFVSIAGGKVLNAIKQKALEATDENIRAVFQEVNASGSAEPVPAQTAYTSFYTGQIEAIGKGTLNLHVMRGHSGIVHPVNTDDKTEVVLLGGKAGKLSDLAVGQWIKVYWVPDPNDAKQQRIVKIEPSMAPWVAARLAALEKDAAASEIGLMLFLDGKGDVEELHFLGPDHPGGYKDTFVARLSKDDMVKLLRTLALLGFLNTHVEGTPPPDAPTPPYLKLCSGKSFEYAPWASETLKRLEGLKAAGIDEKAALKLARLLTTVQSKAPASGR